MPPDVQDIENKVFRNIFAHIFVPENVRDPRIDEAAQRAIARMACGDQNHRMRALVLLAGVKSGAIAGIHSDESEAVATSRSEPTYDFPEGRGAILSSPIGTKPAPVIIFRERLRHAAGELDQALFQSVEGAWKNVDKDSIAGINTEPGPERSISCMVYCGLCAIALADPIPGDKIPACLVCLTCATDV